MLSATAPPGTRIRHQDRAEFNETLLVCSLSVFLQNRNRGVRAHKWRGETLVGLLYSPHVHPIHFGNLVIYSSSLGES